MKRIMFFLVAFVCLFGGSSASIIEINETQYGRLPPLYALDDWARCMAEPAGQYCLGEAELHSASVSPLLTLLHVHQTQYGRLPPLYALDDWARCMAEPAGQYCLVEAELHSASDSPLLTLLQAYSAQTLKHYNHSRVHRGVCVTRACPAAPDAASTPAAANTPAALQPCINRTIHSEYGVEATVLHVRHCQHAGARRPVDTVDLVFAAACLVILALNFLGTTYHVLVDKYQHGAGNKFAMCFSLKKNWSVITFDRTKPRGDSRMSNLSGIEGLRVLTLQGVIFSHVLFVYLYSYIDNPHAIEKMYDEPATQALLNGPLWIQVFFSIGAFLLSYTFLIDMETRSFTWWLYLRGVVVRWMRLTPLALFALGFTMTWFAHLGSGPQWELLVTRETEDCRERWWYHLLYVHNYLETGKFCMGHTWYLACDFQLVLFGLLAMLLVVRFPRCAVPLFAASLALTVAAPAAVVYLQRLEPIITAQSPESVRQLFAGTPTVSQLYIPGYMNGAGYVLGLATGYLHYHLERAGIKLNTYRSFNILFHLSLLLCNVVVFTGTVFLHDHYHYTAWSAALYAALDRTLVALFINIFLLGMFSKCKSALCGAMEWRGLQLLGRLTYCAYLVHFLVLRLVSASTTSLGHVTSLAMVSQLISTSVLTYCVSLPLVLMIELPLVGLEKALSSGGRARGAVAAAEGAGSKSGGGAGVTV